MINNNKFALVSDVVPKITQKLSEFGFGIINTEAVDVFIPYEQKHADMQCFVAGNTAFVLDCCDSIAKKLSEIGYNVISCGNNISGKYPLNICLNAKIVGDNLIGNIRHLDNSLVEYCTKSLGLNLINVNQGYAACSIAKVNDKSVITSDESICRALTKQGIDVLKITPGNIKLSGATRNEYGFIGGASGLIDSETLLFFGNITDHPDYCAISKFCSDRNVNIKYITDIPLTDIGGFCLLNN